MTGKPCRQRMKPDYARQSNKKACRTMSGGQSDTGAEGLDEAVIKSIDIGTLLEGDAARAWLMEAARIG